METSIIINTLPRFLNGTILTLEITALSVIIGFVLAIPLSIMRVSKNPLIRMPAFCFNFYFRGTPLLVQLFLIYYGSGQFQSFLSDIGLWQFFREAYFCAVLSLTLNTAAYSSEIFRGGIEGVPFGEIEAARACGMSGILLYRRIIMPAALRIAWPAYTNEVVFLLQASSLVSIITLMDITGVARVVSARSFAFYELFITAAVIYLILVYGLIFVFKRIERKITAHLSPDVIIH
ncbi:ABC-type arginine/histidine transport system, permease component [Desulforapulum autotrophicum HRM2]|uniref:ABC-type arginine/histidine transport system, permease component n=1 Tax=Desulforapulum autotrophicum (strain ATCC 43914 / DSM 3382 / VKM B-1955 / HRM2) TaxID=177437 RepID=C0QM29_DESAH|nr:ABC transporter permease [Desulforapulum autotrophicum]ACN14335.1 ABC-type arginine/histidine transport system, permease component [Desulforapulum autotrophicum HRM2]